MSLKFATGGSGTTILGTTVLGDTTANPDVVPNPLSISAQSAYPQATVNTAGANLNLAGGIGRRFFTIVSNAALATKTITLTANGTLVTLTAVAGAPGANQFQVGTDDTAPQLAVTATNLAAAIAAQATLGPLMTPSASAAVVYLAKTPTLNSLVIASGTAGALVTATSGADGGVVELLADGSITSPSLAFAGLPAYGWYRSANAWFFADGSAIKFRVGDLSSGDKAEVDGNMTVNGTVVANAFNGNAAGNPPLQVQTAARATAARNLILGNGDMTATAGVQQNVIVAPAYNQTSGNASNYDFMVWRTETALGSGIQRMYSGGTGAYPTYVERWGVDNAGQTIEASAEGAQWIHGQITELLTLSTVGTTTDTTTNLLPANSIIEAVVARVTTTITTATNWELGDATTPGRFTAANSTLAAGTVTTGLVHVDQTAAAGPRQTTAAKLRVPTTGTPGAGVIRLTTFYRQFVPPAS